jgi:hypothetical protein
MPFRSIEYGVSLASTDWRVFVSALGSPGGAIGKAGASGCGLAGGGALTSLTGVGSGRTLGALCALGPGDQCQRVVPAGPLTTWPQNG